MLRLTRLRRQFEFLRRFKEYRQLTDTILPATFSKLDVSEQAPVLDGYLSNGFIIRGGVVHGSVALLPRALFSWKASLCVYCSIDNHSMTGAKI